MTVSTSTNADGRRASAIDWLWPCSNLIRVWALFSSEASNQFRVSSPSSTAFAAPANIASARSAG